MSAPASAIPRLGPARPAVRPILLEHLEEAAFLWIQRRRLLFSADIPMRRLAAHDARIAAHLDGLAIGAATSVEVALQQLEEEPDDPWIVASALRTWLDVGEVDGATAFARLDEMPPGMRPSWREALRWCADGTVDRLFPEARTASLPAPALALGIEALAARGRLGSPIAAVARGHAEAGVRSALARVLGWPGTGTLAAECLPALVGDADAGVRRRARWSAGLRDPAAACEPLLPARPADVDAFDARLLGLLGDGRAAGVLSRWAEEDRLRPAALRALGDMGSEEAIETLLRVLAVPDDAVRLEASTGLERALGPLGGEPGDDPVPADPSAADSAWRDAADRVGKAYACFGLARPWAGEAREEPMWWTWRAAILRPTRTTRPLTREVPDGFWDARESLVARPGE